MHISTNLLTHINALVTINAINATIVNSERNSKLWDKVITDYNSGYEYGYNEYIPPVNVNKFYMNHIDSIVPVFVSRYDNNYALRIEYALTYEKLMDEYENPTPKYQKYGFKSFRFNDAELLDYAEKDVNILSNDELTLYYMYKSEQADRVIANKKAIAEQTEKLLAWTPSDKKYFRSLPSLASLNMDIPAYIGTCNYAYSQYAVKNQVRYIGRKKGDAEPIPKVYIDIINNWNDQLFDDIKGYVNLRMIETYQNGNIINGYYLSAHNDHDKTMIFDNDMLATFYELDNISDDKDDTSFSFDDFYPVFNLALNYQAFKDIRKGVAKAVFDKKGTRSKMILVSYETSVLEYGLQTIDEKDCFKMDECFFYDSLIDINKVLECMLSAEKYALYTSLLSFMVKTGKGLKDFSRYYALTETDENKIYKSLDNLICKIRDCYKIALAYKTGRMDLFKELVPNTKSQKRIADKLNSINIKTLDIKLYDTVYHASAI